MSTAVIVDRLRPAIGPLICLTMLGCGSRVDLRHFGESLRPVGDPVFEPPINRLRSLKGITPRDPKELTRFIRDRGAAIALGKAFFWDMQAGSDGQACASCHFHAGADNRTKNQLNPGLNNTAGPPTSGRFDATASGAAGGPNYVLTLADYPFHQVRDVNDANSAVLFDSDDVTSSQGVVRRDFVSIVPDSQGRDTCADAADIFNLDGVNIRRVEPRNTPTMINAAFFFRSFWDGRANNVFNGVTPFGPRDDQATILELQADGALTPVKVRLENASAASQAVGPILSGFEMSCSGRGFADVGKKLLQLKPLGRQQVAADDCVLGGLRDPSGVGLAISYTELIQRAFDPNYWSAPAPHCGFSQMESNFSLFWGLAIMLYEDTLISDDAPIDRFLDGDREALTAQQLYGKSLFEGQAGCINCHHGPAISSAAFDLASVLSDEIPEVNAIERMALGDGKTALYDNGFYNIGVRPTGEDVGIGGTDPFGNPLSFAREAKLRAAGQPIAEELVYDKKKFALQRGQDPRADERDAVDGCFKVPSLRNVELTGPYFHNGGQATLAQVVAFYNRGGDRRGGTLVRDEGERIIYGQDSTAFHDNETNMDVDIQSLFLTEQGAAALVAFLESFTDDRVRWEKAPFDHPQLFVPNGVDEQGREERLEIPAVGAMGRAALGLPPLKGFMEGQ
jgi:cytochrome c peroxidase